MEKKHDIEVRKTKIIEGSPNVIFSALTEPEKLAKWFQDEADLDVRVGGQIRLVTLKDKHPEWNLERNYYMEGTIMEFVPNKRFSYSWKFKDTPNFPETLVTWELEQINPNKTLVKLSHVGFSGKEKGDFSVESHTQGWTEALDKLAGYCESPMSL
ncbi:MAG: SRPBCC domain-containing protein [Nitrosopumilales archaeon]|nr:MAG: SRPBCC domain-containing protein [Nitrosopumilales archaeon]